MRDGILGRRFSRTARHADHRSTPFLARPQGKILECTLGIGHEERPGIARIDRLKPVPPFHHYRRCTFFDGGAEKFMPVVVGPTQRKIHVAGILCPGVHTPTSDRQRRRVIRGADSSRNFLKIQRHGSLGLAIPIPLKHFSRHGAVVEVDGFVL